MKHSGMILAAVLSAAAFAVASFAETYTWNGPAAGGSWQTDTHWTPVGVPGAGDTAILPNVASGIRSITVDAAVTLGTLQIMQTTTTSGIENHIVLNADLACTTFTAPGNDNQVRMTINAPYRFLTADVFRKIRYIGGGEIVKTGSQAWKPNYGNPGVPFTGTWTIEAGTFQGYLWNRIWNAERMVVKAGALLEVGTDNTIVVKNYTLAGSGSAGAGALVFVEGINAWGKDNDAITQPVTLSSNTVVGVPNAGYYATLNGPVDGVGGLTKKGPGILILSGTGNAFTGAVVVEAGTLQISSPISTASAVTVESGATLIAPTEFVPQDGGGNPLITVNTGGTWEEGPNVWWRDGGAGHSGNWSDGDNWIHGVAPGIGATVGQDVFLGPSAARTITTDVPVELGSLWWDQAGTAVSSINVDQNLTCATFSANGAFSALRMTIAAAARFASTGNLKQYSYDQVDYRGTGWIVKNGADTWDLRDTTKQFAGTWELNAGTVSAGTFARILNSERIIVNPGATFRATDSTPYNDTRYAYGYTLNGEGFNGQGALWVSGSNKSIAFYDPFTLPEDAVVAVTYSGTTATFSGAVGGDGTLIKTGAGKLVLSGSCTNNIRVAAGVLGLPVSGVLNPRSTLNVLTGAKIDIAVGETATVSVLRIDGVKQAEGFWGQTGSGADHIDDAIFIGSGLLHVKSIPSGTTILLF